MGAGSEPQPVSDAFANIREGGTDSKLAGRESRGKAKDRHLFAGVIGTNPGRVVAVVGGQDEQVVVAKPADQFGQARIEGLERARIARNVAAVAVFLVEVDEVDHDEVAVTGHLQRLERAIEQHHVA